MLEESARRLPNEALYSHFIRVETLILPTPSPIAGIAVGRKRNFREYCEMKGGWEEGWELIVTSN